MDLLARIRTHIHAHAHTCTGKRAHYAAKLTACLKINTYPQTHLLPPYYSTTHTTGKRARYATKDLLRSFGHAGIMAFQHANNDTHAHTRTQASALAMLPRICCAALGVQALRLSGMLTTTHTHTHTHTGKRARHAAKDLLRSFGRAGTTAFRHANNDMYPRPNVALMGGRFGAGYPGELCVYLVVCAACVFV